MNNLTNEQQALSTIEGYLPIKMIKQEGKVLVINPYLTRVSNYLKNLGDAKWDASQQGWLIDADF